MNKREALELLGLHNLGLDIGESFHSVRVYQIIETQYQKKMSEIIVSTSTVLAKKYVTHIREAYLELKRGFIELTYADAASRQGVVVDNVPLVIDLTADDDRSTREDMDEGAMTLTDRTGLDQMIGIRVRKHFWFKGKVTYVWSHEDKSIPLWKRKNWHVEYEDGDEEDLLWQELTMYQKDDLCNIELGHEGYEFWKSFELEGTVTRVHQYKRCELNDNMCGPNLLLYLNVLYFVCSNRGIFSG